MSNKSKSEISKIESIKGTTMMSDRCISCKCALSSDQEKNRGECGFCKRKRLAAAPLSAPICKNCGHHKNYHCHGRLSELIKGNCCCGGYEPLKAQVASSPSPISNESLLGMQSVERNTGGEAQRDPRPSPSPTQLAIDLEKAKQWLDVEIAKSAECPNVQAFMTMSHAYLAHVLAAYASHSNSELLERVQKLEQLLSWAVGNVNENVKWTANYERAKALAKAPETRNV